MYVLLLKLQNTETQNANHRSVFCNCVKSTNLKNCTIQICQSVLDDWACLSIRSFSTKMKSTLLFIMEMKVLVQTKTSSSCASSCLLGYTCGASNLSVSQAWPLTNVWLIPDLLCWTVHLETNTKMTHQMLLNSLTRYEHSGVLLWCTAHTCNTTHRYFLRFLALVKAYLLTYSMEQSPSWEAN